jgi:hypothetical protein
MQVMEKVCSASMLEKRTCPGISLKKGKDSWCRPAGEWRTVGKTHVLPADLSIANSFLAACEKDPLTHSLHPLARSTILRRLDRSAIAQAAQSATCLFSIDGGQARFIKTVKS